MKTRTIQNYHDFFTQCFMMGRWDKVETLKGILTGIFWIGAQDRVSYPELKGATEIHVTLENKIYKVQVI